VTTAVLTARREAGGGLFLVGLDVDEETARGYTTPGQYLEIRTERANGYFVLAGDEGARRFELLVRNAGDAADALVTSPMGTAFATSGPLGEGFPLHGARGRRLVVAVVGSALAVARPVVRRRLAEGEAAITQVLIGLRSAADLPLADEVEGWAELGVRVVLCLSRAELHHHRTMVPRAERASGYVQSVLAKAIEAGDLAGSAGPALVVAAGPEAMLEATRALARSGSVEVVTNV
jgi:NAD(P)H-flavin reductase